MTQPLQPQELRQTISAMLQEAEITAEELYQMLFGHGKTAPDLPEYSQEQMMSEGTFAKAGLGQDELEIVAAHVDIRSALTTLDLTEAPLAAMELSELLGEEITALENGELVVKRKFAEWKKALRTFLSALSFKQLLAVALKLAEIKAPALTTSFLQFKNRPEERAQLEQFILNHAINPSPPVMAALAIAGMPLIQHGEGMEFSQPFKSFALSLNMPELDDARAVFDSVLNRTSRSELSGDDIKRELQNAKDEKEQQQKAEPGTSQPRQSGALPNNKPQDSSQRPPRMKNAFGLSKAARREMKRQAEDEKERALREKLESPIKDEPAQVVDTRGHSHAPSGTSTIQQMATREYLRDRAEGNIPGLTSAPRTAQNPGGEPEPAPAPTRSGRFSSRIIGGSPKAAKDEKSATPPQMKEPITPPKDLVPQAPGPAAPAVQAGPKAPRPAGIMPDGINADMLRGFSGISAQDASISDLGQKKSSLPKDDKIVLQTKPTPQIER